IDPKKDVDGFSQMNIGSLLLDDKRGLYSCTPLGIIHLILSTGIDLTGKHAVVVGRSNEVGKPVALMLLQHNATVTICHSKTRDLGEFTRTADVLVVAVGQKKLIKGDMVKEGAVVIDVGINRDENGKLCGDVDFESVEPKASYITPVPGGVGPMTIAMLMANTLKAAKGNVQ
ncbi:MAG TPA: bifunctional 5,10-methylene-tetrahydrofolate dehydrogenase/5,10-methylene-tetrahydrofolate cyclohydrolase, partial [Clostridiales bacterium]|nr:bifunctional 5,10-methylene-tetrahydrofolate dehydrogenase/5,10-methylene-tetrahydrofolate cyclohydrolase [Clostridiales bacterium]